MTDIFNEILADRNEERKLYYFKKLIPVTIILVLAVVIFMLTDNWRGSQKIQEQQQLGDILTKAIFLKDSKNVEVVSKSLDTLINANNNRISELAAIKQIDILLKEGADSNLAKDKESSQNSQSKQLQQIISSSAQLKKELEKYHSSDLKQLPESKLYILLILDNIINNKNYSELTTAYARLLWLSVIIDNYADPNFIFVKKLEEYLNYFNSESKPFFGTVNIIKAIWYIKTNSKDLAKETLKKLLLLNNITPTVKEQAKALLVNL